MGRQELISVLNDNMEKIGVATGDEVHKKGLWHNTFHCWVIQKDEETNEGYILFQKRSKDKENYPDILDITAAGHIKSEETIQQGIRELYEELGLSSKDVKYGDLVKLGVRCEVEQHGEYINREFCHNHIYVSSKRILDYNIQEEEVSALLKIKIKDGINLFSGKVNSIKATGFELVNSKKKEIETELKRDDIIRREGNYYISILIMAERLINDSTSIVGI